MHYTLHNYPAILACVLSLTVACQSPTPSAPGQADFLAFFAPLAIPDTLRVEVPGENDPDPVGDSIPAALFFSVLDSALLQEIAYVAEAGGVDRIWGLRRFSLSLNVEACVVYIQQLWFKHISLLLYNRRKRVFTARHTLAEWYGGESGQMLVGSWLLDYDDDGDRDIVRRVIQYSLLTNHDHEVRQITEETAEVLLWYGERFEAQPTSDTAALARRYPIRSYW